MARAAVAVVRNQSDGGVTGARGVLHIDEAAFRILAKDCRARCTCDVEDLRGPLLVLDPNSAMHLALVLHELATNARKYGALSVPDGRLSVTWELRTSTGRDLLLQWKESNGPTVHAPSRRGFGTTLIEQTVKNHGGDAVIRYGADGVTCLITMPITVAASGAATAVAQRAAAESEEVGSRHDSLYGKRILIVEDEPLVAMDMAASLVAAGCEVAGPAGNLRDAKRLVADADFDALFARMSDLINAERQKLGMPPFTARTNFP